MFYLKSMKYDCKKCSISTTATTNNNNYNYYYYYFTATSSCSSLVKGFVVLKLDKAKFLA